MGPAVSRLLHTDYHYYRPLQIYWRINVIVYLNEDWSAEDGAAYRSMTREGRAHWKRL